MSREELNQLKKEQGVDKILRVVKDLVLYVEVWDSDGRLTSTYSKDEVQKVNNYVEAVPEPDLVQKVLEISGLRDFAQKILDYDRFLRPTNHSPFEGKEIVQLAKIMGT